MSVLYGDIIFMKNKISNIGAVFLYRNQKNHYIDYFILLNSFWEYMPTEEQLIYLKTFIKKYYKNDLYIQLFNKSVNSNKIFINKFKNFVKSCSNK